MDDDDDDPLAFIASIEQSAPQDIKPTNEYRCPDCDVVLEEIDDNFICPSCDAQANILQVEEAEIFYDEMGRAIVGQAVNLKEKTKKHQIDYGWAWSTDEAIVDILNQQITALEKCGLVPNRFRQGVKNMWLKYWIDYIAPYIKDEYSDADLIPVEVSKTLSLRDIEVLVKVRDKVMLPERSKSKSQSSKRIYKMYGARFYKAPSKDSADTTMGPDNSDQQSHEGSCNGESEKDNRTFRPTRVINLNTISILTLDRTLAFLEATARCMDLAQPLLASDLVRACCQRVIPFFGAHRILPEGMNLNEKDRLMFRKFRPPNPYDLSYAASLLAHKVYQDQLPKLTPVPSLKRILERLIKDMNLPYDLLNHITDSVDFSCFKQTRPLLLKKGENMNRRRWPLYDRWAFSILLSQLKKLFSLNEESVLKHSEKAREESRCKNENIFILHDWLRQTSFRLNFILSYDSYAIYHPMTNLKSLQPTSQLYSYITTSLDDRVTSKTRVLQKCKRIDETFRDELTEFVVREIPKPLIRRDSPGDQELEKPRDITSPMQDAFHRTKRYWMPQICDQPEISELIFRDFSYCKLSFPNNPVRWTIYDDGCPINLQKFEISQSWPYWFKLLLSVGGYLCYCQPQDLLQEFRHVEEYLYPELKVIMRKRRYVKP